MRLARFSEVQRLTTSSWRTFGVYLALFVPTILLAAFTFTAWGGWSGALVCVAVVVYYLWASYTISTSDVARDH